MKKILILAGILCIGGASAQNVGIDTETPTERLDVNGNMKVRGLSGDDLDVVYINAESKLVRRIDAVRMMADEDLVCNAETVGFSWAISEGSIVCGKNSERIAKYGGEYFFSYYGDIYMVTVDDDENIRIKWFLPNDSVDDIYDPNNTHIYQISPNEARIKARGTKPDGSPFRLNGMLFESSGEYRNSKWTHRFFPMTWYHGIRAHILDDIPPLDDSILPSPINPTP